MQRGEDFALGFEQLAEFGAELVAQVAGCGRRSASASSSMLASSEASSLRL